MPEPTYKVELSLSAPEVRWLQSALRWGFSTVISDVSGTSTLPDEDYHAARRAQIIVDEVLQKVLDTDGRF